MQLITALVVIGLASHSLALSLGSICSADSDCNSSVKSSYCAKTGPCTKGVCVCPSGQVISNDGTQCVTYTGTTPTVKRLGDSCGTDTDCTGYSTGARCTSGKCACGSTTNKANAADGINCQPYNNGDSCSSTTAQCGATTYGTCSSNTCTCQSGYKWVTSGDVPAPGGCFSNSVSTNLGSGTTGCSTASTWYSNIGSSTLQFCSSGLRCAQCPAGDSYTSNFCTGAASSLAVATVTIVLAALVSLLL